jgi:hypothetical protein
MSRLSIFMLLVAAAPFAAGDASAQETIRIGAVQSMTGSFNPIGKQVMAGARLYLQEHGYTMAGKKIELRQVAWPKQSVLLLRIATQEDTAWNSFAGHS